MEEVWKDVPGYEGWYQISNLGRVKSLHRVVEYGAKSNRSQGERILANRRGGTPVGEGMWYLSVILCKNRHRKQFKVHRLVADVFCQKPRGCDVVNHIDNDPENNAASNLEWTTVSGNNAHRHSQGRSRAPKGEANGNSALTAEVVEEIKRLLAEGSLSQQVIASRFGTHQTHVSRIGLGKSWAHIP